MTQETGGFAAFNLNPNILAAVAATGYEEPSAIQQQSIPIIMAGKDMIGQAQTGTGKTAAFALPILHCIDPAKREPQALILAPTRELALQVATAFETYAKQMPGVTVVAVYGGAPMGPQLKAIRNGAQIVVATPGRLCDHLRRDEKVLSTVNHLVLDEADEMLKLGFMDDLEVIFKALPPTRQTVLFSATLPQSIRAIAERHLRDPEHVKIQTKTQTVTAIEQAHLLVHADQKTSAVLSLLEVEDFDALIMFVRTKQATPDLADIKAKITPNTKALVIINPNNPTGAVYSKEVLLGMLELARQHNLVVFSDEIYDKILYDDAVHVCTASLAPDLLCLTFNGLSKSYRVAGFRSGWIAISGPKHNAQSYIEGIDMLANMRLCANVPSQHAIQTALGGYQSINDLVLPQGRLLEQRNRTWELLNAIPGVSCVKPMGALYAFPRIDPKVCPIFNDEKFVLDLLLSEKLLVVQGTAFNWPWPDHFRVVTLPRVDDLDMAIGRIGNFLKSYRQ